MPTAEFRGKTGVDYYGDFTAQVDATASLVLNTLNESGLAGNTLVVFTSDNGAHWLPEDIAKWGIAPTGTCAGRRPTFGKWGIVFH